MKLINFFCLDYFGMGTSLKLKGMLERWFFLTNFLKFWTHNHKDTFLLKKRIIYKRKFLNQILINLDIKKRKKGKKSVKIKKSDKKKWRVRVVEIQQFNKEKMRSNRRFRKSIGVCLKLYVIFEK